MIRTESRHQPISNGAEARPRLEMMMPRLTHAQMLAILREGGVPESEARRWVDREAMLANDSAEGS